ncbi:MAG: GNAT family N-acetyltransferase [Actinomycetota bacterium]|nr:GNAT family N-acetyltransferase [Actinomycetota bacterium]
MEVTSLAWLTDLALLRLGGSEVTDRGDHLEVRTPLNPTFWWGNFLLVDHAPHAGEAPAWVARHREAFAAQHVSLGVQTAGTRTDLAPLADLGLEVDLSSVMTAAQVHPPPRPNREATYRPLASDDDWRQQVELSTSTWDGVVDAGHRLFEERRAATQRRLVHDGYGQWFGAFEGERLLSSLGLVQAGDGLARFQNVGTRPEARGRGLAGTLVHHASAWGLASSGANTLVMVADPDYLAIRVYCSVGFVESETQLSAALRP